MMWWGWDVTYLGMKGMVTYKMSNWVALLVRSETYCALITHRDRGRDGRCAVFEMRGFVCLAHKLQWELVDNISTCALGDKKAKKHVKEQ